MDLSEIATAVVALLAPYFVKAGEEIAKKTGESAWKVAEKLYQTIRRKFTADQDEYAEQTLSRMEDQPASEARQVAVANIIKEKTERDPQFATELMRLVQEANHSSDINQFLVQMYDNARVNKIINISQAHNVNID